jgi:hypothetical protein
VHRQGRREENWPKTFTENNEAFATCVDALSD